MMIWIFGSTKVDPTLCKQINHIIRQANMSDDELGKSYIYFSEIDRNNF
jgi:hypothetical protein